MPPFFDPEEYVDADRRRLPHWQQENAWVFVTWRLADSLPKEMLAAWMSERADWLGRHPQPWNYTTELEYHSLYTNRIEQLLDAGHGSCLLRDREVAAIAESSMRHFDGHRYKLGPFVIMPNHVHALFQPVRPHRLEEVMHSWKSYTSHSINRLRGTRGHVWQEEYWDRLVRNEAHWFAVMRYIERNPAKLPPGAYILGCGANGIKPY